MTSQPRQTSDSANLKSGDRVGAYRVERELGSGGMADVYYAIHVGLERPSALKILRPLLASDETHLQRFQQEARAAASLVHPNIVQVYDVGQDGDLRYIAQEYIPGSNLRQYLSRASQTNPADNRSESDEQKPDRQLAIRESLSILLQVLAALSKSASSGIIHRDIKPENIMLTPEGDVKVADFGLARLLLGDDPQLTRAGTTLGTPMYMSPEQLQEGQVDIRSDLYSLGVTLYHMLTGRPPFTGETPLALAMQHVQATVPDLQLYRNDIPPSLRQLVGRLLSKSADERFDSPQQVLEYLRAHRKDDLAEHWPDHTIPLPDVAVSGHAGPTRATLLLQQRLREKTSQWWTNFFAGVAGVGLLMAAFLAGNFLTYTSPDDLLADASEAQNGIPRLDTPQAQYRWALLDTSANRVAKWEAVSQNFPPQDKEINRLYGGLADLQLARYFQESGDVRSARER
ncbi:MAG: serine/threonine-protein kinase [Pirellulaceae bacterium]